MRRREKCFAGNGSRSWKQRYSLDEEEVAIVMESTEVIERGRKDKLPALRNVPKKKLLEETAKVDKVLSNFKTHSITKTNELFYALFRSCCCYK